MNNVGARRSVKAISANPMATADDLAWLQKKDPVAALQHPNCPPESGWELAAYRPLEAMSSALYWMLTLESPERWEQLQQEHIGDWVYQAVERLPFREQHLYAADCVEHVLHIFERDYPMDLRIRNTIEARRHRTLGKLSLDEWETVRQSAADAHRDAFNTDASHVAFASYINSVSEATAYASAAAGIAASAVSAVVNPLDTFDAAKYAERLWQWKRVQQYRRGEVV